MVLQHSEKPLSLNARSEHKETWHYSKKQLLSWEEKSPLHLQIKRAHQAVGRKNGNRSTPRNIALKFLYFKDKEIITHTHSRKEKKRTAEKMIKVRDSSGLLFAVLNRKQQTGNGSFVGEHRCM